MSAGADWLDELQPLALRIGVYDIGPDPAGLPLAQPWEVFLILPHLVTGSAHVR